MVLQRFEGRARLVQCSIFAAGAALALTVTVATQYASAGGGGGGGGGNHKYKGSESLELLSVAPNPARCGAFPNFEAHFEGQGIDTAGGVFTVESSGCQNIETGEVFDLVAVDTYLDGSSVNIVADPFFLEFDPQTCVSSNTHPVPYEIDGGTGAFAGASGFGKFHFASNDPGCNGEVAPAFVWFKGKVF